MVRDDRKQHEPKALLLGVGFDKETEDPLRVTRGENFRLVGGSEQTHETMQEKCVKFNEKLQGRGKRLEQLEPQEYLDIAAECEMNTRSPGKASP